MAVFPSAESGVLAALSIQDGLSDVEVAGHRPRLRAKGVPRELDVHLVRRTADAGR